MERKRLVLLDAHAIIHRAYHALPEFTGPEGQPTGALYGLVSMLLGIITELKPDYLAACYDLPGPTIRHEAYEAYKGTRAKTEDALVAQLKSSRKVFEAFAIPCYERAGFEADDLLGTIALKMRSEKNIDVVIASGDMDTLQLVADRRVMVYTLKRGLSETILYDEKAVEKRFGFLPALIPDYKGLRGDPSDNIKGVPGVGEKTASQLVQKFGALEGMFKKLKKSEEPFVAAGIKPRMIALLKKHEEDAIFSKMLATIRTDAPIAFALPTEPWRAGVDVEKVVALCDEFGFRSLRARVRNVLGAGAQFGGSSGPHATEDPDEGAAPRQPHIAPARLAEAAVMLWLISSEFTNPSLDDILAFTRRRTFDEAYAELAMQVSKLGRLQDVYEKIEKPLIPVVRAMEQHGVLIDPAVLAKLAKNYRTELALLEKKIYTAAGHEFNVGSPKQLATVLFDEMRLTPQKQKKTPGGERSTRESELVKIRELHPIIAAILDYRELKKLLSTYIETIPPLLDSEHRLHAEFLQTGTTTGRMASQNPNLQNIPLHSERGKAIRHAFVAPPHFTLLALDYSQIELRLAAILSGDEKLCEIFRHGRDVHTEVAAMVFGVSHEKVDADMRRKAKVINFGILYGMGANALRAQLGSTTAEAHQFLEDYFKTFKTLAEYLETTRGFARKHGYTETLFGRRRQFPEMKSPLPYVRAQAERMAINAPLQGTQADIIKLAMVQVDKMLERENASADAHLLLQVHDELVYEIHTARIAELSAHIKKIMESALRAAETRGVLILAVGKTGPNWGDMQPL
ncbi:hypothetical protein HY091_01880 [Candidatus Kaiserbacteria bacterium]|nr:hypothetical protein [Candidatus Kaiserbacteria bacterium]